jgi:hypothetical protein
MAIEHRLGGGPNCPYYERAHSKVWYETSVHDVYVDVFGTQRFDLTDLLGQPPEVGAQN